MDSVVSLKFNGGGERFGRVLKTLERSKYSWKFGSSEILPESIKPPLLTSSYAFLNIFKKHLLHQSFNF